MTESEAIKELHEIRPRGGIIPQKRAEALDVAIQALEKQIPKKPFAHQCTTCGSAVLPFEGSCCSNCGQKLDWSNEKMKENVCITCEYYEECNKPKREIKCIGYKENEKENE